MPRTRSPQKLKCSYVKRDGNRCGQWAITGGTVCQHHGGFLPGVKKAAAAKAALMAWGLDSPTVDPGEQLLRLVSQSAARCQNYATEIADMVAAQPRLRVALTADVWKQNEVTDDDGETSYDTYKAGEYIRAMVLLENDERDRCAKYCAVAINAGLREREVQVAERQGWMLAQVLRSVLGDARLGLSGDQRAASAEVIDAHIARFVADADAQLALESAPRKR